MFSLLLLSEKIEKLKIYHVAHSSFEIFRVFRPWSKIIFLTLFLQIFFCDLDFLTNFATIYPKINQIRQKLCIPHQNTIFGLKWWKSGQNQKNAYNSGASGPRLKPFRVVNSFGSRVPTMPKWFRSLTVPIPVSVHPCEKSPLESFMLMNKVYCKIPDEISGFIRIFRFSKISQFLEYWCFVITHWDLILLSYKCFLNLYFIVF